MPKAVEYLWASNVEEIEARLRHLYEGIDGSDAHNLKMREILDNLRDSMLAQSQLEGRQSAALKERAELITRTERNLAEMTVLSGYMMKRDNLPEASR